MNEMQKLIREWMNALKIQDWMKAWVNEEANEFINILMDAYEACIDVSMNTKTVVTNW